MNVQIKRVERDTTVRVLIVDIMVKDISFIICNLYAPNEDNPSYFVKAFELLDTFVNPHKIIAGDLNLCFDLEIDKRGTMYKSIKALELSKHTCQIII